MRPGDEVEYATHAVSAQADGSFAAIEEERWERATVLAEKEHAPLAGLLPEHEAAATANAPDRVLTLAPADGSPPLDLNAALVRPCTGR